MPDIKFTVKDFLHLLLFVLNNEHSDIAKEIINYALKQLEDE